MFLNVAALVICYCLCDFIALYTNQLACAIACVCACRARAYAKEVTWEMASCVTPSTPALTAMEAAMNW